MVKVTLSSSLQTQATPLTVATRSWRLPGVVTSKLEVLTITHVAPPTPAPAQGNIALDPEALGRLATLEVSLFFLRHLKSLLAPVISAHVLPRIPVNTKLTGNSRIVQTQEDAARLRISVQEKMAEESKRTIKAQEKWRLRVLLHLFHLLNHDCIPCMCQQSTSCQLLLEFLFNHRF